ncbi:MDR family MFS transporter [Neomicrococcus lactis]|uniref:MDR family MFS transporter n=1 Tax=Neomicrococcus lactis TaxID=732241 RepID=UPI0023010578|nr:MDR family MFS transporter [Neomicrococcus lactis]
MSTPNSVPGQGTPPTPAELAEEECQVKVAWGALFAMVIGFFIILVDSTIVSTAMPAIMRGLDADINGVVWVNSAYLLAIAVPLLITGRLGDRFGPKNIFLIGVAVFTVTSLWCGLATDIHMLIVARVFQGLGAALMMPQSMTVITRLFPPHRRGAAMGLWGAVAGIASLVGPLAGGVLVDTLGWEWVFFVNIPIGIICIWRVIQKVPSLEIHNHSFDWLGVALSGVAMFLMVFGIQEGNTFNWGRINDWVTVPMLIGAGIILFIAFIVWQNVNKKEPLLPLQLFKDWNFSFANIAIACMGLAMTAFSFPIMLYLQSVRGLTPTQSALMIAPMALMSLFMAPVIGKAVNKIDARLFAVLGFLLFGGAIVTYGLILKADTPLWQLLILSALMGLGSSTVFPVVSLTATRDLGQANAGAGSGIYNTTRQLGAVLGSALIALAMESRIADEITKSTAGAANADTGGFSEGSIGQAVPEFLHGAFSSGLGQSLLVPGIAGLLGAVVCLFFRKRTDVPSQEQVQR